MDTTENYGGHRPPSEARASLVHSALILSGNHHIYIYITVPIPDTVTKQTNKHTKADLIWNGDKWGTQVVPCEDKTQSIGLIMGDHNISVKNKRIAVFFLSVFAAKKILKIFRR